MSTPLWSMSPPRKSKGISSRVSIDHEIAQIGFAVVNSSNFKKLFSQRKTSNQAQKNAYLQVLQPYLFQVIKSFYNSFSLDYCRKDN